ncbi:MAG: deaminase [Candidatus Saccharimonadales bacterium]
MREPLFTLASEVVGMPVDEQVFESARQIAGLYRATNLAIESALRFASDMPVGAVALQGSEIVGRGFANDIRFDHPQLHAEVMALYDTRLDFLKPRPDTIVATLEPCPNCQDVLARQPGLKRVAFGLSRQDVADRGLVRPHSETITERSQRVGLPYEVVQIDHALLRQANLAILDSVHRDQATGAVSVDQDSLVSSITELTGQNN